MMRPKKVSMPRKPAELRQSPVWMSSVDTVSVLSTGFEGDLYSWDAEGSMGKNEGKAIPPLRAIAGGTPSSTVERHTHDRLRLPKMVSQILNDVPEHWRDLARALASRVEEGNLHTLLVTSALVGEGATTVSIAVAASLAMHTELHVALVDADFANPSIAHQLKMNARVGMEHHLLEHVALEDVMTSYKRPSLSVLPTLEKFELPSIVEGESKVSDLLDRMRSQFDLVVVDRGSIFAGRKPVPLPKGLDATLVVRDPSKSGPQLLDQLDRYLSRQGVSSLGVIENGVDR